MGVLKKQPVCENDPSVEKNQNLASTRLMRALFQVLTKIPFFQRRKLEPLGRFRRKFQGLTLSRSPDRLSSFVLIDPVSMRYTRNAKINYNIAVK